MNLRFSQSPRFVQYFLPLVLLLPLITPVNFAIIQPGDGTALFPKVLTLKGSDVKSYSPSGQLYLLSIWVSTPDSKILGAEAVSCWIRAECVLFPRSVIYKKDTTTKRENIQAKREMKQSQSAALIATKKILTAQYPAVDISQLRDSSLKLKLSDVGGPSGGFIFSLAMIELLTPEDILRGRKVAGSGTITAEGKVGAIGGIAEKILAAKKAGAEILFAATENCDEIPEKVSGISIIAISTLGQALSYLQSPHNLHFRGVKGCTNLGA